MPKRKAAHALKARSPGRKRRVQSPTEDQKVSTSLNPEYHPAYSELDNNRFCTRLLQLLPPSHEAPDEISCNISPHYLDTTEKPKYEALSYTWGDPTEEYSITVNSRPFRVRKNLMSALRHLRLEDEPRWLWIDAICINQASNEEKSTQVTQMHRIYHLAHRVVIWLGDSIDASGRALDLFRQIAILLNIDRNAYSDWHDIFPCSSQERKASDEAAMAGIFSRPWWTRVWVIQEAAYTHELVFMCRKTTLDITWVHLAEVHDWIGRNVSENYRLGIRGAEKMIFSVYTALEDIRRAEDFDTKALEYGNEVLDLLGHTRNLLATDPRDYVFAILNLDGPPGPCAGRRLIPVSYEMDTASVFTSAARAIINLPSYRDSNPHLDILCSVEIRTDEADFQCHPAVNPLVWAGRVDVSGLPSWVPNWAQPPISCELQSAKNASRGLKMQWSIEQETGSAKNCILRMRPLRIGVIATMGIDFTCTNSSAKDVFQDLHDMAAALDVFHIPYKQTYNEVVSRTLSGGGWEISEFTPITAYDTGDFDDLPQNTLDQIAQSILGRRSIALDTGFIGLAPRAAKLGDLVYIVPECSYPIAMREGGRCTATGGADSKNGTVYQVIGPCYIHGVMSGEASELTENFVPDTWQYEEIVVM
ncbi:HET-domain-containing protein [Lentithecium fluviatile CBS 122367]|uniref:HET-domain-containing protein n=1 Tax=Lentithecium fluviatile CBS 122367 TaxID=1168545 RepID=A0A6G1IG12_9PLEO|nr:HET-domain-containing protein [Lentithecium fluviatile CBS 122367]